MKQIDKNIPDVFQGWIKQYERWSRVALNFEIADITPIRIFEYRYLNDERLQNQYNTKCVFFQHGTEENAGTMYFPTVEFKKFNVEPQYCFCTRVCGESMHPTLIDRGTVLLQMQNSYTIEGIYLFRQVNELRIKRLQRVNSHTYRIISDNKEFYPVETLDLRDMESHEFEIYGKYLWDCAIRP